LLTPRSSAISTIRTVFTSTFGSASRLIGDADDGVLGDVAFAACHHGT
jgi:hypothetical protein